MIRKECTIHKNRGFQDQTLCVIKTCHDLELLFFLSRPKVFVCVRVYRPFLYRYRLMQADLFVYLLTHTFNETSCLLHDPQ